MSSIVKYNDIIAFHPGEYVKELIEDYEMTQEEFAKRLGTTPKHISKLVNGEANISPKMAHKLSNLTGTSIELWLNLQKKYELKLLEIEQEKQLEDERLTFKQIDYSYFVRHFSLPPYPRDIPAQICALRKKLSLASLVLLQEKDLLLSFRNPSGNQKEENIINSNALVSLALNKAKAIDGPSYSKDKLFQLLPHLRTYTLEKDSSFLPKIQKKLSDCGISFILLPHLRNANIHGAVKKIPNNRILLLLSDRYKYADIFWFSLFHEIAHILNNDFGITFSDKDLSKQKSEMNADAFAQNTLLDNGIFQKFSTDTPINKKAVLAFSQEQGIHPGIVVGRLQYRGIIERNSLNQLRDKIDIHELYS